MMLKRIVIAVVLCLFVAVPVFAQQKVASSAEQLIGYWTLVSVTNEKDGKITETFGPNPKGLFIFDRSGRYVVLQFKADIPQFASNSRDRGTPEENSAVVQGSSVHFGTYTVNEKEGSFTVRPEAATFPNWVGIDQKRSFSISDDVLMITNPSGSTGGTSRLVLKRAK